MAEMQPEKGAGPCNTPLAPTWMKPGGADGMNPADSYLPVRNSAIMATCSRHPEKEASRRCKLCSDPCCDECTMRFGLCAGCWYKVLVVVIVVMVIISYTAWYALL
jgi:hypothetical protein